MGPPGRSRDGSRLSSVPSRSVHDGIWRDTSTSDRTQNKNPRSQARQQNPNRDGSETACRRDSVHRRTGLVAIHLCGLPGDWAGRPSPSWPCSEWGLPSRPGHPGRWCALTAPFHPYLCPCGPSAVCSLWHFPAGRPDWPLASTLPCGVPTFLDMVQPCRGHPAVSLPAPLSHLPGTRPNGIAGPRCRRAASVPSGLSHFSGTNPNVPIRARTAVLTVGRNFGQSTRTDGSRGELGEPR